MLITFALAAQAAPRVHQVELAYPAPTAPHGSQAVRYGRVFPKLARGRPNGPLSSSEPSVACSVRDGSVFVSLTTTTDRLGAVPDHATCTDGRVTLEITLSPTEPTPPVPRDVDLPTGITVELAPGTEGFTTYHLPGSGYAATTTEGSLDGTWYGLTCTTHQAADGTWRLRVRHDDPARGSGTCALQRDGATIQLPVTID